MTMVESGSVTPAGLADNPGPELRNWVVLPLAVHLTVLAVGYLILGKSPLGGLSDEVFVLVMSLAAVIRIFHDGLLKRAAVVGTVVAVIFLIGFVSNLANPELGGLPVFRGAFISSAIDLKIYILVFCYIVLFHSTHLGNVENTVYLICKIVIIYSLLNLMLSFADVFRGVGVHNQLLGTRAGMIIPQGLFDHKFKTAFTHFLGFASACALVGGRRHHWFYVILAALFLLGLILNASVKELIGAFVILPVFFIFQPVIIVRIGFFATLPIVIVLLSTTQNRISDAVRDRLDMFVSQDAPKTVRGTLYAQAPEVAKDFFPFGSGWATFGSSASRDVFYSPLYYIYGVAFTHGGSEDDGSFLVDTFWPKILAELGFIGALFYASIWIAGFWAAVRHWRRYRSSLAFRFATFLFVGEFAISFATPVYNYADGAIFGALSLAILLSLGFWSEDADLRASTRD